MDKKTNILKALYSLNSRFAHHYIPTNTYPDCTSRTCNQAALYE